MKASICPRCDSERTLKVADSLVKGVFELYRCEDCNYVWRSTEDLTGISRMIDHWRAEVNRTMQKHLPD
ncbi:non-oxidative hydroxyarylic acid decarboxylases subunit D [Chloroflexota bacterium]